MIYIYIHDLLITYLISQQPFDTFCVILMVGLIYYSATSKIKLRVINFAEILKSGFYSYFL